jgi:glutamate formiminotransferase
MGVFLASRGLAQVSMNLLDYRRTAPRAVGRQLEAEARKLGVRVREYELVGCASSEAFEAWPDALAPVAGLKPTQLLEPWVFASADPVV